MAGRGLLQRLGNAEAAVVGADVGRDDEALRRTDIIRTVEPRSAAHDAGGAVAGSPRAAVGGRARVVVVGTVLDPLQDIPGHIVKTEGVRRKRADGRGLDIVPFT